MEQELKLPQGAHNILWLWHAVCSAVVKKKFVFFYALKDFTRILGERHSARNLAAVELSVVVGPKPCFDTRVTSLNRLSPRGIAIQSSIELSTKILFTSRTHHRSAVLNLG